MRGEASYLDYFIYCLPVEWMNDVLLGIPSNNIEGSSVSWGEILTYFGLWLLMSSVVTGGNTHVYWDNLYPSNFKSDPFRLHIFISFTSFDAITKALSFTDHTPHLYRDTFWEVRQMIHTWNWHMPDIFLSGLLSCLDGSISIWTSRWTCQGFMFVPRKPLPVGNEYYTISDGLCGILFGV